MPSSGSSSRSGSRSGGGCPARAQETCDSPGRRRRQTALTSSSRRPGRSASAVLTSASSSAGSLVLAAKAAKRARMKWRDGQRPAVTDDVADDRDGRTVRPVGQQVEVAGHPELGRDEGRRRVEVGDLRQVGRRQRRSDRLEFLGGVLEHPQPVGDPGDRDGHSEEEDAANDDRQGEFRSRVDRVGNREEGQADDRQDQRRPQPEPPRGEADRQAEEKGEADGGGPARGQADKDGEDRGGDPGDVGGSRRSPRQLALTLQQPARAGSHIAKVTLGTLVTIYELRRT